MTVWKLGGSVAALALSVAAPAVAAEMVFTNAAGNCFRPVMEFAARNDLLLIEARDNPKYLPAPCAVGPCSAPLMMTTRSGEGTFKLFDTLDSEEEKCLRRRVEITAPPHAEVSPARDHPFFRPSQTR